MEPGAILPGTLDLLILKAVSLGPLHGYAILLRLQQLTGGVLNIEQGAVYPALYRLEHQGFLKARSGLSENKRRARFYSLTAPGRKRLQDEVITWHRLVDAIGAALATVQTEG